MLIVTFRSQSARTILWSKIPGMEMQALTREGLLQRIRGLMSGYRVDKVDVDLGYGFGRYSMTIYVVDINDNCILGLDYLKARGAVIDLIYKHYTVFLYKMLNVSK